MSSVAASSRTPWSGGLMGPAARKLAMLAVAPGVEYLSRRLGLFQYGAGRLKETYGPWAWGQVARGTRV